jgi:lipopolysaccharide/colanic/teichoic acid biosynthesis glycosyltransferase
MSRAKRWFDVFWAGLGLLVLSPVLLLVALCIKLSDHGPILYRQQRVGKGGRLFWMLKFRTMVVDADKNGQLLTVGRDPRTTALGRWIRKLKLDELPQLWNVVVGEMSLVGPRPEVPRYVALYTPEQWRVLDLMPGITDPASIRYRNESALLAHAGDPELLYVSEIVPDKIRLNLEYAAGATVWTDFLVVLSTLGHMPLPAATPPAPPHRERRRPRATVLSRGPL